MSGAQSARRALSGHGEVKGSAADALRAALNPPKEPELEMSWFDIALELKRANDRFEAERQARAEAEANQPDPEKAASELLAEALRGRAAGDNEPSGSPTGLLPLNGAALLHQAVAGQGNYTINGAPA